MPRKPPAPAPEPQTDPEWASECLAVVRRAQRLMAMRPETRQHKRRRMKSPGHEFALIPQAAEAWRSVCRRPECRRSFSCAFGARRRDKERATCHDLACWRALPKAVSFAMAVALRARYQPYVEDEPCRRQREEEVMRIARIELHAMEMAAGGDAAGTCRTAS